MTRYTQNLLLTEELGNFIALNPQVVMDYPNNSSYVIFTNNNEFNKISNNLLKTLLLEGQIVVKANKTNNSNNPWTFSVIYP